MQAPDLHETALKDLFDMRSPVEKTELPKCKELFQRLRWDVVVSALDLPHAPAQVILLPMAQLETLPHCTTPALVHAAFQSVRTWVDSLRIPLLDVEMSTRG